MNPIDSFRTSKSDAPFLRNCWYVALWAESLSPGRLEARRILDEPVVLFRNEDGHPVALRDVCPHRSARLSLGRLLPGGRLACGYHGLEFDSDGTCVRNPHEERIPPRADIRRFPTIERDSIVWIWMGDQEPDPATIPDFGFLAPDSGYDVTRRDLIRMNCDYRLLVDNLLDLSHIAFLHEGILGSPEMAAAELLVEAGDDRVAVTRVARDVPVPALFALMLEGHARGDLWNTISWQVPSALKNDAVIAPTGGDRLDGAGIVSAHLLTPEAPGSTLYYIAAARQKTRRPFEPDEQVRRELAELRRFAFEMQDLPMINSQTENMTRNPELTARPVFLKIDAGPAQAQAILKRRIAAEQVRDLG